jgi:hypothetical protein
MATLKENLTAWLADLNEDRRGPHVSMMYTVTFVRFL